LLSLQALYQSTGESRMKIKTVNNGIVDVPVTKILFGVACLLFLYTINEFYYVVNPGDTGIHLRMGSIVNQHTDSGIYFKLPYVDNVITINNRS